MPLLPLQGRPNCSILQVSKRNVGGRDLPWGHSAGRARPGFTSRTPGLKGPHPPGLRAHCSKMPRGAAVGHSPDTETHPQSHMSPE